MSVPLADVDNLLEKNWLKLVNFCSPETGSLPARAGELGHLPRVNRNNQKLLSNNLPLLLPASQFIRILVE